MADTIDRFEYIGIVDVNGDDIHIARDNERLYAGLMFNTGFCPIDEFRIDTNLSIDVNIQNMVKLL